MGVIILDIKHSGTGESRTDGRYSLRIGSEVEFVYEPCVGCPMCLNYISDSNAVIFKLENDRHNKLEINIDDKVILIVIFVFIIFSFLFLKGK